MSILNESAENLLNSLYLKVEASSFLSNHPKVKELNKLSNTRGSTPNEIEKSLEDTYNSLKPELDKRERALLKLLTKVATNKGKGNVRVLTDVKSLNSVKSKALKRGKSLADIGDLVRGALLFDYPEDVEEFVKRFRRKNSNIILDYEGKERGGDHVFGYHGSHHFDLNIDGLVSELQVMTKKLWSYKAAAHEVYNKYRDILNTGGQPSRADAALSKKLFDLGNKPKYRKESLEEVDFMDGVFEAVDILSENLVRASSLNKLAVDVKLMAALVGLSSFNGMKNIFVNDSTWTGKIIMPDGEESKFAISPSSGDVTMQVVVPEILRIQGKISDVVKKVKNALNKS